MSATLVTAPTDEPITLAEAKAQARITDDHSNGLLRSYIQTAREAAEQILGRGLLTQTWRQERADFADVMWLPMAAPLQNDAGASPSTAPIVEYYDTDGTLQTLATSVYDVDTVSRPGRIVRAAGQSWPAVQCDRQAGRVRITYVVGWISPAEVPEQIKQGIRSYVTALDADRDGMHERAEEARFAAERCWMDRVYHIDAECA